MRKSRTATVLAALCVVASTLVGCGGEGEDIPVQDEQQQEQEGGGEEDQHREQQDHGD